MSNSRSRSCIRVTGDMYIEKVIYKTSLGADVTLLYAQPLPVLLLLLLLQNHARMLFSLEAGIAGLLLLLHVHELLLRLVDVAARVILLLALATRVLLVVTVLLLVLWRHMVAKRG